MKTIITILTAVLLSQAISAQTTIIPDANFEQALIDLGYDTGTPDGSVLTANISSVTYLQVANKNISDLTGIEDFAALDTLQCQLNLLTSLNVTQNTALTYFTCFNNLLTNLDVSNNTALVRLSCDNNQLTSLDVSNNTALERLYCSGNQLTSLDVNGTTALFYLDCPNNQLTSLDVSNNTALFYLECNNNQLTSLDVSGATALTWLYCFDNQLTSLDVSNNTALGRLYCSNNQLTSLDLSQNIYLFELICQSNQLTCLNIQNTNLLDPAVIHLTSGIANPNLTCIEVDDVALATTAWGSGNFGIGFDSTASFSTNCNNTCSSATTGTAEHEIIGKTAEHGLSLTLHPNPVASYLVIETEHPSTLNLYNTQGQLLLDQEITATYTLNTSGLSRGIYLLQATDKQGRVYSQKIIKE